MDAQGHGQQSRSAVKGSEKGSTSGDVAVLAARAVGRRVRDERRAGVHGPWDWAHAFPFAVACYRGATGTEVGERYKDEVPWVQAVLCQLHLIT